MQLSLTPIGGKRGLKISEIVVTTDDSQMEDCEGDGNPHVVGSYCHANSKIYISTGNSITDPDHIAKIVFHEYVHALQATFGLRFDELIWTNEAFAANPNQEMTKEEAAASTTRHIEINADCVSLATIHDQKLFTKEKRDFMTANELESVEIDGVSYDHIYGKAETRSRLFTQVIANPSMQACNVWSMPLRDIQ